MNLFRGAEYQRYKYVLCVLDVQQNVFSNKNKRV